MAEIHHFTYGWITPALAYALSVLGSVLGLTCAVRVRDARSTGRKAWWLTLAAWAIGGTGIWVMHFMAMLGFSVTGSPIRYDIGRTLASAVVSVAVVGIGLFVVGMGRPAMWKIVVGGTVTGLGVNAMHYLGMAAMRLNGDVAYDRQLVGVSVVIAVVAATVALWLSVTVRRAPVIVGSAFVMALAVSGMHYTGMAAMSVQAHTASVLNGAAATTLLLPIVLAVIFVVIGLCYAMLAEQTADDRAGLAYLDARRSAGPTVNSRPAEPHGGRQVRSPDLWRAKR